MSMSPKDGDIIKEGIAALLDMLIGSTGDAEGSLTEGTVFAKENAILQKVAEFSQRTLGNMVLKQSESKTAAMSASSITKINFTFEKAVRIIALYISGVNVPQSVYIINGEDSFCVNGVSGAGYALLVRDNNEHSIRFRAEIGAGIVPLMDIWATQLDCHYAANEANAGKTVSLRMLYQEEGR